MPRSGAGHAPLSVCPSAHSKVDVRSNTRSESSSRGRDRQLCQHQHFVRRQCAKYKNSNISGPSNTHHYVSILILHAFSNSSLGFPLFIYDLANMGNSNFMGSSESASMFPLLFSEPTFTLALQVVGSSESIRMVPLLLFGIHHHVRISFGRLSGIHKDVSFSPFRNPKGHSHLILNYLCNPSGGFLTYFIVRRTPRCCVAKSERYVAYQNLEYL